MTSECEHEYHPQVVKKQTADRWYNGDVYEQLVTEDEVLKIFCVSCGDIKDE